MKTKKNLFNGTLEHLRNVVDSPAGSEVKLQSSKNQSINQFNQSIDHSQKHRFD